MKIVENPDLVVLSLGAGVQSSVLALMAEKGLLHTKPNAAVFADTQWEPQSVYSHLTWLEDQVSFPIFKVTHGNIRSDRGAAQMPVHAMKPDGKAGATWRNCTRDYKVNVIAREIKRLLGYTPRQHLKKDEQVEQWIGISTDEIGRMKDTGKKWLHNRFPLIEADMSREDCLDWFSDNYPDRPLARSACVGCPYHSNKEWSNIKFTDPVSWADAVDYDRSLRDGRTKVNYDNPVFLHWSGKPLEEVDLKDPTPATTLDMDCEGLCGN
jgi:hypothetical protein